ncbi:MAG TPA: YjbF family lipoprotein [Thermohalobaculum sp.]|nr:YjbF family lipoprotein [Thermohalobaculum sp.]
MTRTGSGYARAALAATGALVLLAGCTKGTSTGDRLFAVVRGQLLGGEEAAPAPQPTRAQLDQIPAATIGFSFGDIDPVYMVALADNGGYVTYQDKGRRGVVLKGGAIAGTLGLGDDLYAVKHAQDDPIANRTPVAEWPAQVVRSYEYRVRDLDDYVITVSCELELLGYTQYEIVEVELGVAKVRERCSNAVREFENTYWADLTGFVWASEQWMGPDLEPATIEVVRPYGG